MNENEVKLKTCPFCGGRAYFAVWGKLEKIYIDCEHINNCGNHISGWINSSLPIEEQVLRWNTRFKEGGK